MSRNAWISVAVFVISALVSAFTLPMTQPNNNPHEQYRSETPLARFTDITASAGIHFRHFNGADGKKLLPETMGSGVAVLDYDRDGHPDLFFVNSCPWPGRPMPKDGRPTQALYRNRGDGTFEDVTVAAGLDVTLFGMSVAVGDFDNDGWPDYSSRGLAGIGCFTMRQRAMATRTFRDVTGLRPRRRAGLADDDGGRVSSVEGAVVVSRIGDVARLRSRWQTRFVSLPVSSLVAGGGFGNRCRVAERRAGLRAADAIWRRSLPTVPQSRRRTVRRCLGSRGIQVERKDRVTGPPNRSRKHSASSFAIRTAMVGPTLPWRAIRNGICSFKTSPAPTASRHFREIGLYAGVAFAGDARPRGGMGIDVGDIASAPAIVIANFSNEPASLFHRMRLQPLLFSDRADAMQLAAPSRMPMKFGTFFFDFDLDGRLDLFFCNGHLEPDIARRRHWPDVCPIAAIIPPGE